MQKPWMRISAILGSFQKQKNAVTGAGERIPSAKHLLCKHEGLGSDPQHPHREAGASGGGAQGDRDRRISRILWLASTASQ